MLWTGIDGSTGLCRNWVFGPPILYACRLVLTFLHRALHVYSRCAHACTLEAHPLVANLGGGQIFRFERRNGDQRVPWDVSGQITSRITDSRLKSWWNPECCAQFCLRLVIL